MQWPPSLKISSKSLVLLTMPSGPSIPQILGPARLPVCPSLTCFFPSAPPSSCLLLSASFSLSHPHHLTIFTISLVVRRLLSCRNPQACMMDLYLFSLPPFRYKYCEGRGWVCHFTLGVLNAQNSTGLS